MNVLKILFKNLKVTKKLNEKLKTWNLKSRDFYSYQTKPKFDTKVLQILHGHSVGSHFLISFLTLFRMGFFGAAHGWGGAPSLQSVTHILQWWKTGEKLVGSLFAPLPSWIGLKPSRESLFLISAGICSQIFGPK